ncbi:hypothetical protein LINGRAHAP2_LOCUS36640 [Linum grandiflorum]
MNKVSFLHLVSEPDGNCGFQAIAHYYFGDQERYMEIEAHWDIYYSMLYLQTLAQVKDKVGSKSGPCGQDHWMDDIDLLGIATLFNWSIVVYAWGYGKAFGRTYLPLSVGPGVSRPTSIVSLVNNGTHWVLVQLCDVDGVYALTEFHGMWTGLHNHHEVKCVYASEVLRPPSIAADWAAPVRKPLYMCVCQAIQPITQHVQPLLPSLSTLSIEPNSIPPPCKRSPNIPTREGISSVQARKVLINPGLQ